MNTNNSDHVYEPNSDKLKALEFIQILNSEAKSDQSILYIVRSFNS